MSSRFFVRRTRSARPANHLCKQRAHYERLSQAQNMSMAPKLLLLTAARFTSVQEILAEVNRRNLFVQLADGLAMSMGTVSKALEQLEDELIVGRNAEIRLLQADILLEQLQQNYEPPDTPRCNARNC